MIRPLLAFGLCLLAPALQAQTEASWKEIGRLEVDRLQNILVKEAPAFTGDAQVYSHPRHAVRLFTVSYPSVIPEQGNRPTLASGLVAIPDSGAKRLPIVSYQHGTVMSKLGVPSSCERSPETLLMIAQFASQGYAVIGADYFGLGQSTEPDGYVVLGSHQQACFDMLQVGQRVLSSQGIEPAEVFLTGWSQGGVVTMSFLDKLEGLGVPVRAAGTASAQCDGLVMLTGFLQFPRPLDAPWVSAMFILTAFSYENYYRQPGLARSLFTEEQYDIARRIYEKQPYQEAEWPGDLKRLIRKEYFDPVYFRNSAYGKLVSEIRPYRWQIRTPVRMYYGDVDECLTIGLARLPSEYQHAMGNNLVQAISAGPDANHRKTFARAVPEWKRWFDECLKP